MLFSLVGKSGLVLLSFYGIVGGLRHRTLFISSSTRWYDDVICVPGRGTHEEDNTCNVS